MSTLLCSNRRQQMLCFIQDREQATIAELSNLFNVSEATVRRDLDKLQVEGMVRREHGGAVAVKRAPPEPPIVQRAMENAEEKRRIGQAAAELVHDGEVIFLGAGTTTLEVARNLGGKKNLTVITNALTIANELATQPDIAILLAGGLLRHSELSTVGFIVVDTLRGLHADKVFRGIRAIDVKAGLSTDYLWDTMIDRAIMRLSPEMILVVDHTKFGRVCTGLLAPITSVSKIVTDAATPAAIVSELRELGVDVILA